MNRGSMGDSSADVRNALASMRPRFMNRGSYHLAKKGGIPYLLQ